MFPLLQHFLTPMPLPVLLPVWTDFPFNLCRLDSTSLQSPKPMPRGLHQPHHATSNSLCSVFPWHLATYTTFSFFTHASMVDIASCPAGKKREARLEGDRSRRAGRQGGDNRRAAFVCSTLVAVPVRLDMCSLVTIGLTMASIAYTVSASHNNITCPALVGV